MLDKEVGELWHKVVMSTHWSSTAFTDKAITDLIRKLVEERALVLEMKGWLKPETTRMAWCDFGIPEEGWK